MRTIAIVLPLAAAVALSACATSGAQPATTRAAPPPQSPVATRHPYEMKGTLQSVGGGVLGMGRSLTIARDEAPAAVLRVADETRITVDGRVSNLSALRPGDDVRALFDFDEGTPVAIEVEAKPRR